MPTTPQALDRRQLLAAVAGVAACGSAPAIAGARPVAFPASTALIERGIAARSFPGAVAAFGQARGAPVFVNRGTLAFDSQAPAGPDTLWRIYSMTKPAAGMAAMLLIDEGRLKLDQPVADFIPAFAQARVLTDPEGLQSRPAARPLTVRHLLTHTGGIGGVGALPHPMPGPLIDAYKRLGLTPGRGGAFPDPQAAPTAPSLAEFAERLAGLPLLTDPGARWNYSLSIDLLGRVIEVASGQSFDGFLQRRLFAPLGMTSTGFVVPEAQARRLAANYLRQGDKTTLVDPGPASIYLKPPAFPSGGAGLVSSARDYDRFLAMIANRGVFAGRRVMSARAVDLATSNLLPEGVEFQDIMGVGGQAGFGAAGVVTLSGPAAGDYGWAGAAGSVARANPRRGTRMAGYINVMGDYSLMGGLPTAALKDFGAA